MLLSKERIGEYFSRAAATYDQASDFQRETGRVLIERMLSDGARGGTILDAGMGTGAVTQVLADRLSGRVFGCDIAWGMALFSSKNTKGIFIAQADTERLPYRKEVFDVVFSNIVYQWSPDLESAFLETYRILKNDGRFYFSILTRGSVRELYETIKKITGKDYAADFFPAAEKIIAEITNSGLNLVWSREHAVKRYYESPLELLRRLKKMGAGRVLEDNVFGMGKRRLFFEMLEAYSRAFSENGRIFATYNVILGCAKK